MQYAQISLPYTIKIIGDAGEGIISTADMLQRAIFLYGLYSSNYREFPSTIRGGYTASVIRISNTTILSPLTSADCLFIRSTKHLLSEIENCKKNAIILVDSFQCEKLNVKDILLSNDRQDIRVLTFPLPEVNNPLSGFFSSFALGIIGKVLNIPDEYLRQSILIQFSTKGNTVVNGNLDLFTRGFCYDLSSKQQFSLPQVVFNSCEYQICDGNEAIGLGTVLCGCKFVSLYPITPATTIGTYLSLKLPEKGGVLYQAEDEIAAAGSAIGSSFSGAKSMTITSGPGLSLIQEFIGYASMVELPLVIVDVQRPGPSTGSPSKFGQEDLLAAAFGSHGESPRIILSPTDTMDCFTTIITAFNFSEQYQCPVIVLSDSVLGLTKNTIPVFPLNIDNLMSRYIYKGITVANDTQEKSTQSKSIQSIGLESQSNENFQRYKLTDNGLNPVPVPGISPVSYCVTGIEHDESGYPSDCAQMRVLQQQKRFRKLDSIETDNAAIYEYYCEKPFSDIAIISWGITVSIVNEAIGFLNADKVSVTSFFPRMLFPVCKKAINHLLTICNNLIVVESNFSGQYAKLIRMYTDAKPVSITSSSGIPFTPEHLYQDIMNIVRGFNDGTR